MDPEQLIAQLPPWAQRGIAYFQHYTRGTNWYRMSFIFLPAIIRGDLASMTLYLPFAFGYLLRRSVEQWTSVFTVKNDIKCNMIILRKAYISWAYKMIREFLIMIAFLAFCWYMNSETRFLCNFFLSSFVVPMIRACFPQMCRGPLRKGKRMWDTTWGDFLVHVFMVLGLWFSWKLQGMDQLFLGFLFLIAIPLIQDRYWVNLDTQAMVIFIILGLCLPFFSVGLTSKFFPSYLEYFPRPYLSALCYLANATPKVKDYYSILGVSQDSDAKTIKKVFREMSIQLHPDKVGDDPVLLERFHQIREASDALTKGRAEYDKAIENQELNEIAPRCEAFLILMYFWLLHCLMDYVQYDDMFNNTKKDLKKYILMDRNLDFRSLGLHHNETGVLELKKFLADDAAELPAMQVVGATPHGTQEDIMNFRKLLSDNKIHIGPYPLVKGKIAGLHQQLCIRKMEKEPELSAEEGAYDGWTATVDGIDTASNELKTCTTTVARYETMFGQKILTLAPELDFEPEMGNSRVTLSPPAGSKAQAIKAELWFHVYRSRLQVIQLGEEEEDKRYEWKLSEDERTAYTHYKFEVWSGDTLLGFQRVHEYLPEHRTVILRGPLTLTGAGRPVEGASVYTMYPDQLVFPNEMNSPMQLTLAEEERAEKRARKAGKGKAGG